MFKSAVIIFAFIAVSSGFMAIGQLEPKPEKYADQPGCYVSSLDRVIPFGDKYYGNDCTEHRCTKDLISIVGCGVIAVPEGCKQVADTTKKYPHCCPHPEC